MKKSLIIELIIFLILMSVLSFVGLKAFKHTFDIGTTYHLSFKDINGIVIGSPVRILGVDIGHVTKINSDYDKIYVDFIVNDSDIKIPKGTKATIEFFGIAGSRSIELTPPSEQKQTNKDGFVIEEPIRLGGALSIMSKFIRASMVSIGGLYEFAKKRTQGEVDDVTDKFLKNTAATSRNLSAITAAVEEGGAKVNRSIEGTTKGMTRATREIENLNISRNFNIGKYAINLTKRTLIKTHRQMTNFNNNSEKYSSKAKEISEKAAVIPDKIKKFDDLFTTLDAVDDRIKELDRKTSQENLDKVYNAFEDLKTFSEDMNKVF